MDEGIDPTQMCQTLVHKIAQSKQLMAVTDPDILVLFEDWLDELEGEVIGYAKKHGAAEIGKLAATLGLSSNGAAFLITKLKKENKI